MLSLFVGSLVAVALVGTGLSSAHTLTGAPAQANSDERSEIMVSIQKLSPYVVLRDDGTLSLAVPATVATSIPKGDIAALQQSLASTNARIVRGEVVATRGGVLLPIGSNPLVLSDGRTFVAYYWWGASYCISNRDLVNAWYFGYYSGALLGVLSAIPRIGPIAGASVAVLVAEFIAVDQLGGWNGACVNWINYQFITFTPQ
jgi:hypothetical protein